MALPVHLIVFPTVIVPETKRVFTGLAEYATYEAAVKEAAA
jgi:hypothetical protein